MTLPRLFGVVGAGQMGLGIAQVVASSGMPVCLVDPSEEALSKALRAIRDSLGRLSAKGKLQGDPEGVMRLIQTATQMQARLWPGLAPHHGLRRGRRRSATARLFSLSARRRPWAKPSML